MNSECSSSTLQPPSHPLPTLSMHRVCSWHGMFMAWCFMWWELVWTMFRRRERAEHVKESQEPGCIPGPHHGCNSSMFLSLKHQEWVITQVHLSHSISLGLQLNTHRNTGGWYSSHITERVDLFARAAITKEDKLGGSSRSSFSHSYGGCKSKIKFKFLSCKSKIKFKFLGFKSKIQTSAG